MLTASFGKPVSSMLTLMRDLLLVMAFGALGSQILITLNGGNPIGVHAGAAVRAAASRPLMIADLEIELNPARPTQVSGVDLHAHLPDGSHPQELQLNVFSGGDETTFPCRPLPAQRWICPTPGLGVEDLTGLSASGS